jgi:GNAT superfamily N-acetyltransferase
VAVYDTTPVEPDDTRSGFRSGVRALDDYFSRHANENEASGVGRTYALRRAATDDPALPRVLGFYTLSMALIESTQATAVVRTKLPRYPLPVALVGRLAVDERARGQRLGERLLLDALRRIVDVADHIGCVGVIVDAKDERALGFYERYDFVAVQDEGWPRRLFMPLATARAALLEPGTTP